eukprot:1350008-Karenia_brevis.AAC.1
MSWQLVQRRGKGGAGRAQIAAEVMRAIFSGAVSKAAEQTKQRSTRGRQWHCRTCLNVPNDWKRSCCRVCGEHWRVSAVEHRSDQSEHS